MQEWERRLHEYGRTPSDEALIQRALSEAESKSLGEFQYFLMYIDSLKPMFDELQTIWGGGHIITTRDVSAKWGNIRIAGTPGQGNGRDERRIFSYGHFGYGLRKEGFTEDSYDQIIVGTDVQLDSTLNSLRVNSVHATDSHHIQTLTDETIKTAGSNVAIHHKDQIQHIIDLDTQKRKQMGLI